MKHLQRSRSAALRAAATSRRSFLKSGALWVPAIFIPRLIRAQDPFDPFTPDPPPAAAAGSGCDALGTDSSLAGYWRLNEASGTRNDTKNTSHLTDNSTVTQAAGKIDNAALFTRANSETLSVADNANISVASDFTWSIWVYPVQVGINQGIIFKGSNFEYALLIVSSNNYWFYVKDSQVLQSANTASVNTWYHLVCGYRADTGKIWLVVNNGAAEEFTSDAPQDLTGALVFGNWSGLFWDGRMCEAALWKKRLTTAEISTLYNSGNGCRPAAV